MKKRTRAVSTRAALIRVALAVAPLPLIWGAAETAERLALRREARDFDAGRGAGAFVLYAAGDSTAWGEPYGQEFNLAALASRRFAGRLAGRRIETVVLAEPGASTRSQLAALRKALLYRDRAAPAAVLIYCAHNDRTVFDTPEQPAPVRLLGLLARRSFVFGDLYVELEKRRLIAPHADLESYRANVEAMVETSLAAGAVPILSTSVSNQADVDPRLYAADGLTAEDTLALLAQGERLESLDPRRAAEFYRSAGERYPRLSPYASYRRGRAERESGRYDDARRSYAEASDTDRGDNFGRATRAQNEVVARAARERGLPWVDAVPLFEAASPHGLIGRELFSDGHHPNLKGRLLLSSAFAEALASRFGGEPRPDDEGSLAADLGFDARKRAEADVYSGKWWLCSALRHMHPSARLDGAKRAIAAAISEDPENFSARLALALVELQEKSGWLSDEGEIAWLRARGFEIFVTDDYRALSEETLKALVAKMRRAGVSAAATAALERTAAGGSGLRDRSGA